MTAVAAVNQAVSELGEDAAMVDLFDLALDLYVGNQYVSDNKLVEMSDEVDEALTRALNSDG